MQNAATRQGSLSPLFANLSVAVSSPLVPQTLQQAAAQLLAQRTPLTENLTGDTLKTAFQKSGLFLEHNLASPQAANSPDLKAALIVFRQTVSSWLGNAPAPETAAQPQPSSVPQTGAPPLSPDLDGDVLFLRWQRVSQKMLPNWTAESAFMRRTSRCRQRQTALRLQARG